MEALVRTKEDTMQSQSGIALEEPTESMNGDLIKIVASRKSPGIVIVNRLGGCFI